jgi:hypothetical protein
MAEVDVQSHIVMTQNIEVPNGTCFVIAPIGEADSDIRRRSDQVLKHVVRPAAKNCGFVAVRADEISEPGLITTQVIQHIVDDPMVVADLTGKNPNVFYELALRHALRKPYVQIIQKGERIPFDVAGVRTIEVDHRDLDSVESARMEIERQMHAANNTHEIESPISVAVDLDRLRKSDNPEERQLADLFASLSDIKLAVSSVQKALSDPASLVPVNFFHEVLWDIDHRRALRNDELRYMLHELNLTMVNEDGLSGDAKSKLSRLCGSLMEVLDLDRHRRPRTLRREKEEVKAKT